MRRLYELCAHTHGQCAPIRIRSTHETRETRNTKQVNVFKILYTSQYYNFIRFSLNFVYFGCQQEKNLLYILC